MTKAPPMRHNKLKEEKLEFNPSNPSSCIPFVDAEYEEVLRKSFDHGSNPESNGNIYHPNEAEFTKFAFTNTGFPMGAAFSPLFSIMTLHKVMKELQKKISCSWISDVC